MTEKQELVTNLIKKWWGPDATQTSDGTDLYPDKYYWKENPEGHIYRDNVTSDLARLDPSNLKALLEMPTPDVSDWWKLSRAMEKQGAFRVEPKIVNWDYIPCLQLRYDAYLSWFRGYSFQVSGDANGNGSYGSSDTSLRQSIGLAREWEEPYRWLLPMSHIAEACSGYSEFLDVFYNNHALFDEFIRQTQVAAEIRCDHYNTSAFLSVFKRVPTVPYAEHTMVLQTTTKTGTKVFGTLYLDHAFVALQLTCANTILMVPFPAYPEETLFGVTRDRYYLHVWTRLSLLLLVLSKVATSRQPWFPRLEDIKDSPVPTAPKDSPVLSSCNDLYDTLYEIFKA